jgi:gluconolactonase
MKTWTLSDWGSNAGYGEGPVVQPDGSLLTVAIDLGQVLSWNDGTARAVATLHGGPNGLVRDREGRLYVAQNGGAHPGSPREGVTGGVQVIEGSRVRWLTQAPHAPNDLAFGPDGMLYVTDPTRKPERDDGRIWRVDPSNGNAELLISVDWYPNGIGFSEDDGTLWVADTRHSRIVTFGLDEDGLRDETEFVSLGDALPDGFAFDADGNLSVCCVGRGEVDSALLTFNPSGILVASATLPEPSRFLTNLALDDAGTAWVTDSDRAKILRGAWGIPALPLHPFR